MGGDGDVTCVVKVDCAIVKADPWLGLRCRNRGQPRTTRSRSGREMWPDAGETRRLLERVERAEPSAADELWERHRPALRRMIGLRMDHVVERRVDASDVVQEVLLNASQRLAEYLREPLIPFHLWLRQIARDRLIDAHRQHRGAARRSLDRERPLAWDGGSGEFADQSSLDLAAQLRDPELTPAAQAVRTELRRPIRGRARRA